MDEVRLLKDICDDRGWLVLKKGDIREVIEHEKDVYLIYHNDFDNIVTEFDKSAIGSVFEFVEG